MLAILATILLYSAPVIGFSLVMWGGAEWLKRNG